MNCRRFQKLLFDYLDASLSATELARAEAHLAKCSECRQAVSRQKQFAGLLSERLQQETADLELRPQVERRILAALHERPSLTGPSVLFGWWTRLLGATAAVVVITFFLNMGLRRPHPARHIAQAENRESQIAIQVSGCAPVYTFRQEGNLVVDCLSCRPFLVDQILWPGKSRNQSRL